MIYREPVFRPGGDAYVIVEYGDELNLLLNFRVIALNEAIKKTALAGVTETIPTHRSLGVVYNPLKISYKELVDELKRLDKRLGQLKELRSRILTIPIWYNDPWSQECAQAHGAPNNVEFIAEINNITVAKVIEVHSGTLHWVGAVGFTPGCYQAPALSPSLVLTAPKYPRPRKWTPDRIICMAGHLTSAYPVRSPGGYQLLGRTPLDLYDPLQRNPVFADSPVLTRVGDRHRYVPIEKNEYEAIRKEVEEGRYKYQVEEGIFRLESVRTLDKARKGKSNLR
ncbi:MAG: allophanate hydrolase subunit 1 [Candidatus Omnitrophica bacterium]|nr:allophanate hydrolase subunit 1 [Candidatus Omnitrophota bacterium]